MRYVSAQMQFNTKETKPPQTTNTNLRLVGNNRNRSGGLVPRSAAGAGRTGELNLGDVYFTTWRAL